MIITLGSLFDGIGGFPLAARRVGITRSGQVRLNRSLCG